MKKLRMATPGPTQVPQELLLAGAQEIIHHRSPQMEELLSYTNEALKQLFKTQQPVYTSLSSGTGSMEAAVANCFNAGEKVLVVSNGYFGQRFVQICEAYNLETVVIEFPWGETADLDVVHKYAKEHSDAKGILVVYSETSTGVLNDVKNIAAMFKDTETLVIVDAISGLITHPLEMDNWGIDVTLAASHKGFMLPPGLAFFSISDKALAKVEHVDTASYYFSYKRARQFYPMSPSSPAVSLLLALRKSIEMLLDEGLPVIQERHKKLGRAVQSAFEALNFQPFIGDNSYRSNIITVMKTPDSVDAAILLKKLNRELGVTLTGGQAHIKGKVVRFGHVGYVDFIDLFGIFGAIEMTLKKMGCDFTAGASAAALLEKEYEMQQEDSNAYSVSA